MESEFQERLITKLRRLTKIRMKAIIAVNNLGFIGKDNKLMWRCSEDLKHFKKMTKDQHMIVGHNTWLTLPEVVRQRKIVVDRRGKPFIGKFLDGEKGYVPVVCIGGKKTYEKYCPQFTELHISHISDNQIGDCTFPDFSNLNPNCKVFNYYFEVNQTKPLEQYKDEQLGKVGTEKRDEFEEEVEQGK